MRKLVLFKLPPIDQAAAHFNSCFRQYAWRVIPLAVVLTFGFGQMTLARPNIVVFLADDMGWGDLHANNPSSNVPTPNLDRMAAEGMRFTNAHTSASKCAPTRYSAITGNYQWRGRAPWGTWQYNEESQILPGQKTVADMLGSVGYRSAFVGKLHMGGDFFARGSDGISRDTAGIDFAREFHNGPLEHGFQYSFLLLEGIQSEPYAYFENDRLFGDPNLLRPWISGRYGDSVIPVSGVGMPYWNTSQVGPDLMGRAIGFIDDHLVNYGRQAPFFLYFASQSAHYPYTPPESYFGVPVRRATGLCARQDMVYEADVAFGILENALRERNLLNDTLIVFTSDNGGPDDCGHDASGPTFRGVKGQVLEGGHRVPFVVKWGDGAFRPVPAGAVRDQLIGVQDLTATLAAAAGARVDADQARDSFNMLPVWLGTANDGAPRRDHLIAESRQAEKHQTTPPTFAYIEGEWKLAAEKIGSNYQALSLYNLTNDPGEFNNLIGNAAYAPLAVGLVQRLQQRHDGDRSAPVSDGSSAIPAFDPLQYIASHPDLTVAFGANPFAGTTHYQSNGIGEGRTIDSFDEINYLLKYPDLLASFGFDLGAATVHFLQSGYYEGRSDD